MTEQPQYVPPEVAQATAAQQLAQQAEIGQGTSAEQVAEQIRQQVTRDVLLPMETKFDELIAAAKAQSDAQAAQIKVLQAQLAGAQATLGPPAVIKYATAVNERLNTAAALSGGKNLDREHWAGVLAAADQLEAAAKDAIQSGDASKLGPLAAAVEQFAVKGHGRHDEHFAALLGDLEALNAEAAKLAPAEG
jgi:hypothetical protein